MNDPNEDPPPSNPPLDKDVCAGGSQQQQHQERRQHTVRRLHDKVTYYEKVWSGTKRSVGEIDEAPDGLGIDVNALEQRLRDERNRRALENSPKIEVRLRHTPQPSPHKNDGTIKITQYLHPVGSIERGASPINITQYIQAASDDDAGAGADVYHEASVQSVIDECNGSQSQKSYQFEKITLKKVVRVSSSGSDVRKTQYTESYSRTPSEEHVFHDDSAYHTQHSNAFSNMSNTSSMSSSLHQQQRFPSDETIGDRITASRERIHDISTGSWHGDGGGGRANVSGGLFMTGAGNSPVAGGNTSRRYKQITSKHGEDDDSTSLDWYNEYRTHSFQSAAAKMSIQRSNSQYDTHIKEIRGKLVKNCSFFAICVNIKFKLYASSIDHNSSISCML